MSQEEIINLLREHLRIEISIEGGDYGSSSFIETKLVLFDEVISSDSTYLPR